MTKYARKPHIVLAAGGVENVMSDLNATMFYKVKFSVSTKEPGRDSLWMIIMHIRNWQTKKCSKRHLHFGGNVRDWSRLKRGGQMFSADNSVFIKSEYFLDEERNAQFWACSIIENPRPLPGYAHREWITEIGYECEEENKATFSCVVSYSDRAGFIGPYQEPPSPSIPNLIRNIITDQELCVFCGFDVLTGKAIELKVGDWPALYKRIIDPNRQLPYIFISPQIVNKETKETIYLISPDILADKLFGNALIFSTFDPDFPSEMRYMNDDFACYGGAIRVYQPNATDPSKHRYLSPADIETYGKEQIVSFLVRAFAQNIHFYDSFFCMAECKKKKSEYKRKKRLVALHAAHQKQLEQAEDEKTATFDLAAQEEEKRLNIELEMEKLQEDLELKEKENFCLRTQNEQLQAAAEENNSLRLANDARFEIVELPENVEAVAAYFSRVFTDKIVFTEDAYRSMKGCTLPPKELWKVFFSLANTMRDLYKEGTGDIYGEFRKKTGIEVKRGEGNATRNDKKLMKQFRTELNGDIIDIEAHITYSKQRQSIHFGYSEKLKKLVIGHCGEHLDNYSTRKVK